MGVYESLTREELVRKLLTQENLCLDCKEKSGNCKKRFSNKQRTGRAGGKMKVIYVRMW